MTNINRFKKTGKTRELTSNAMSSLEASFLPLILRRQIRFISIYSTMSLKEEGDLSDLTTIILQKKQILEEKLEGLLEERRLLSTKAIEIDEDAEISLLASTFEAGVDEVTPVPDSKLPIFAFVFNPISCGLWSSLSPMGGWGAICSPRPKSHRNAVGRMGFGVIIK